MLKTLFKTAVVPDVGGRGTEVETGGEDVPGGERETPDALGPRVSRIKVSGETGESPAVAGTMGVGEMRDLGRFVGSGSRR